MTGVPAGTGRGWNLDLGVIGTTVNIGWPVSWARERTISGCNRLRTW
jgi:hypothetical protein